MGKIILDLGCGRKKYDKAIGLDKAKLPEVDVICDLNKGIPFKDDSVDQIYTYHFLEHCDDLVFLMEEIWRVSKPNAKITIIVPYWTSIGAFQDPTHKRFFTERTFDYFTKEPKRKRLFYSDYGFRCDFKILKIKPKYAPFFSWLKFLPFKRYHLGLVFLNIVQELFVELEVIK